MLQVINALDFWMRLNHPEKRELIEAVGKIRTLVHEASLTCVHPGTFRGDVCDACKKTAV